METLDFLKSDKWRPLTISSLASPLPWVQDPRFPGGLGPEILEPTPGFKIQDSRFPGGLGPEILEPTPGFKIQDSRFPGGLGPEILEPTPGFKIQDSRFPGGLGPEILEPLFLGSWILGSKISGPRPPGNLES